MSVIFNSHFNTFKKLKYDVKNEKFSPFYQGHYQIKYILRSIVAEKKIVLCKNVSFQKH